MKILACSIITALTLTSTASAQCFGDAAHTFGCGVHRQTEGTLESFGDSRSEVLPDNGAPRNISVDDLFTPEEQRVMYRNIVLSKGAWSQSQGAFTQSIQGGSQPNRYLRGMPRVRARF